MSVAAKTAEKKIPSIFVLISLLSLISFFLSLAINFTLILCMSKFLEVVGAQSMPFFYIVSNGLSIIVGIIFFFSNPSSLRWQAYICFLAAITFAIFSRIDLDSSVFSVYALYIGSHLFNIYAFIMFWNVVGKTLTLRELKRFVGIIYAANAIGAILPGFFINFMLSRFSFSACLLAAAVTCVFMGFLSGVGAKWFSRAINVQKPVSEVQKPVSEVQKPVSEASKPHFDLSVLGSKLILLSAGFSFSAAVTRFFLDYIFADTVTVLFTNEQEMAVFFGFFNSGLRFVQLISQLLFSQYIMQYLSLTSLIGIIPVVYIPLSLIVIIFDWPSLIIIFQFILMYLLNTATYPTFSVLLGVVPEKDKARTRFFGEGVVFGSSVLISGVIIIIFQYLSLPTYFFFLLAIVICFGWLYLLSKLKTTYIDALGKLILAGELKQQAVFEDQKRTVQFHSLLNPDEKTPLSQGLSRLIDEEFHSTTMIIDLLQKAKDTESHNLIVRALATTDKITPDLFVAVLDFLHDVRDFRVFTNFLEAVARNDKTDYSDMVIKFLDAENNRVRSTVLLYILRFSSHTNSLQKSLMSLKALILSPQISERCSAAALIGELEAECFLPQLITLLQDEEISVRKSALKAIFKYPQSGILAILEEMSHQPENQPLLDLLARGIAERRENISQEVGIILSQLDFSRKARVVRTLRRLREASAILIAVRLLRVEPLRLSVYMVEFYGNYKDTAGLTKNLEELFVAEQLKLEEIIIGAFCQPSEGLRDMICQLAFGPEKELFAFFLARAIHRLIDTEPQKSLEKATFCLIGSLLRGYGISAKRAESFSKIFVADNDKEIALAIELIESQVTNRRIRNAVSSYYEFVSQRLSSLPHGLL